MAKRVEVIKATKRAGQQKDAPRTAKLRVAAYARVSSDKDEQENSFDNQVAQWNDVIDKNPNYEKVDVYTDEGISGTSVKKRDGFQRMMADARAGKIDLILCKSISRFARNTRDFLQATRELKSLNVDVYFDNEHMDMLDARNEIIFTILSSIAQEESHHTSENVRWTFEKLMREGRPFVNTKRFLGYDKNEDKTQLVINEEEAKTIRYIYNLYDGGMGCNKIAQKLAKEGYKTAAGNTTWYTSTVIGILKNEKYAGDLFLQKTFTVDFLTHERKKNEGERDEYRFFDAHPAIITKEQWNRVQEKLEASASRFRGEDKDPSKYARQYPLSGMLLCAKCGTSYKRRLWNSKSPTARRYLFQCEHYSTISPESEPCDNKAVSEALTKQACCDIINKLYLGNSKIFAKVSKIIKSALSAEELEAQKTKIEAKKLTLSRKMDEVAQQRLSAETAEAKDAVDDRYYRLKAQYSQLDARLKGIDDREIRSHGAKSRLDKMLTMLSKDKLTPDMLTKDIVSAFFYRIFVTGKNEIVFVINATHTMDLKALIANRADVVALDPIYESEVEKPDPIKKAKLKFRVVTI